MNKIKQLFIISIVLLTSLSCAVKIPMTNNFYSNNKKIGLIFQIDSIGVYKEGGQGLLDMALTSGKKFKKPLLIVNKKINPTTDIENLYFDIFKSKGKPLKAIDYNYDVKGLMKFDKPSVSEKKYYKYDLRFLSENGIDELLLVNVRYGLLVSYYGMIETGKNGNCRIASQVIDLADNSIVFRDFSNSNAKIKGKWKTPPEYANLTNAISEAIRKTIVLEKNRLNN